MNWERVEGQWLQIKGQAKSRWAKLTDDDVKNVGGKKDQLIGIIQRRYGVLKDEAEKQVDVWITKFAPAKSPTESVEADDKKAVMKNIVPDNGS